MAIAAKPFKFLNKQTNLPTTEFQNISSNNILNQVYSEGSSLLNGITSAISSDIGAVTNTIGGLIQGAENVAGSAISAVSSAIGSVTNDVSSVIGNAVSGIESTVSGISSDIGTTISSAVAVGESSSNIGNPLQAVGNLLPTSLTTDVSNSLNVGNIFNTGSNLATNTLGGIVSNPIQQVVDQGSNLISNLGRNVYNGVNSLSSGCINQLLNDLNQYCNLNSPNLGLGLNGGSGSCNPQAVAGLLADMVGGGSDFSIPDLCSSYRQLLGFTMFGAQNGITGVFSPLANTINNQTVTNKAGISLFNYGVGKSNLNLLQDLGQSTAVNAISSSIPNCSSLISQCALTPVSDISTSLGSFSDTFSSVQNDFNSNFLSGTQNGNSVLNVSDLLQNNLPSSSIISSTMSSIFGPSNSVNHVSALNLSLPGSSNNLNSNNSNYQSNLLAADSVLGNSSSGSSANLPTTSTTSSNSTIVGINNPTYAQSVSAADSVLGGSAVSTTPVGYTTVSVSSTTSSSSNNVSNSSNISANTAGNTTTPGATTSSTLYQSSMDAANSVLGSSTSGSGSSNFSSTGTYNNDPYQQSMQAMTDVFGSNSSNNTSTNNLNINPSNTLSGGSSNSYQDNSNAANSVLGSSNYNNGSSNTTTLASSSNYVNNSNAANRVLGSSSGSSTSSSSSLIGTITNAAQQTYRYQAYNNSINVSDVVSNPTQASSGGNGSQPQQTYLALQAANQAL